MTVLYVREQGAVVRRDAEQIKVTRRIERQRREAVLSHISVRELEQIVLYGNVQLTTQAAALLLQNEIDIVFLSLYGAYRGRLSQDGSKFARLRHAQLALAGDDRRSLAVAQPIVQAKLANQRNVLRRLAERVPSPTGSKLEQAAAGIEQMRRECVRAVTADSLRGFEGKGSVFYFGGIKSLLDPIWSFQGRAYHPPPDPFNALLSFGYSLLLKDITATVQVVGLDPYLGCFHALEYGRPSLTLDLMEEFRPVTVDQPMLDLVLNAKIAPNEFIFTGQEERPVELGTAKAPIVIQAYERRLDELVAHGASGEQRKLRQCYELQARMYARVVMGSRRDYQGLVV